MHNTKQTKDRISFRLNPQLSQRIQAAKPSSLNLSQWLNMLLEAQMDFIDRSQARKFTEKAHPQDLARKPHQPAQEDSGGFQDQTVDLDPSWQQ